MNDAEFEKWSCKGGIGTCSGTDTDKFAKFKLTPVQSKVVRPPLIKECLANIECKVIDIITKHNIVVLEAVAEYIDTARKEKRTVHAVGDGTFIVDGLKIDRRKMMAPNIPFYKLKKRQQEQQYYGT